VTFYLVVLYIIFAKHNLFVAGLPVCLQFRGGDEIDISQSDVHTSLVLADNPVYLTAACRHRTQVFVQGQVWWEVIPLNLKATAQRL